MSVRLFFSRSSFLIGFHSRFPIRRSLCVAFPNFLPPTAGAARCRASFLAVRRFSLILGRVPFRSFWLRGALHTPLAPARQPLAEFFSFVVVVFVEISNEKPFAFNGAAKRKGSSSSSLSFFAGSFVLRFCPNGNPLSWLRAALVAVVPSEEEEDEDDDDEQEWKQEQEKEATEGRKLTGKRGNHVNPYHLLFSPGRQAGKLLPLLHNRSVYHSALGLPKAEGDVRNSCWWAEEVLWLPLLVVVDVVVVPLLPELSRLPRRHARWV